MRVFGVPVVPPVSKTKTGLPASPFGHPALHRTAAQPLVLERAEALQIGEAS